MPKGNGKWQFMNGNEVDGSYDQKVNTDESSEDAMKGPTIQLTWSTKGLI